MIKIGLHFRCMPQVQTLFLKLEVMKRFYWHLDAIQNGGGTFLDCFKMEINLLFNKEIFEL